MDKKGILFFLLFCILLNAMGNTKEEWLNLQSGRIRVFFHDKDFNAAKKYLKISVESSEKMAKRLGASLPEEVRIVIAGSQNEFDKLTGGVIPEWGAGAARPADRLIIVKSPSFYDRTKSAEKVITHELSHVLLAYLTDNRIIERWFDEGLAQYQSGEGGINSIVSIGRAVVTNNLIPLDNIDYVLQFQREKASLAYAESRAAVDFIVRTGGQKSIRNLLSEMSAGKNLNDAIYSEMKMNVQDFQNEFFADIKRRYKWAILLDTRLIISLLFIVFFMAAYLNFLRKKREYKDDYEIEDSDEDTPWY